ncbi:MAG: O-antigen ligase family protein [Bacteroidota bacterium]
MTNSFDIKTWLFWLLVLHVSIISVSIAAASFSLALTLLLLAVLTFKEKKWILPETSIDHAVIAYIIIEFVTAVNSDQTVDALRNSKRLLLIGIVYATVIAVNSKERFRQGILLLSASVAVLSLVEIYFYYMHGNERLYVFQHYMTTGGLKMIIALILIPFILSDATEKRDRIYFTAAFVPVILALILTNTRSAWLGLVCGLLVISILYYRKLFSILIAAIILFFAFAPVQQVDRAKSILDFTNSTNVGRLHMWSTGIRMWKDRPLLGFGDIDLYDAYLTYRTPTGDEPAGHLHNNYVHLLVTLGTIGTGIVLFLFFKVLQTEYRVFKRYSVDPFFRNIALGSIAVFSGFIVNGLFEWNFGDHEIMVFVWFTVGLCFAAQSVAERHIS